MPVAVTPARNSRCNSKRQVYRAGVSKSVSKETGVSASLVSAEVSVVTKASGYQRGYQATGWRGAGTHEPVRSAVRTDQGGLAE